MSMARPMVSVLTQPRPDVARPVRTLRAVSSSPGRRRRPNIFFAFVTVVTIFIIIVAQILLSISLQSGAYEIAGLQREVKSLGRTYQSATQDLSQMTYPQNVSQKAEALGMVGNTDPVYLRLSDSAVTGVASAAASGETIVAEGNLVPNEMLDNTMAAEQRAVQAGAAGTQTGNVTSGSASAPVAPVVAIPSPQGMPSPATH